jgi:hypothetical protein
MRCVNYIGREANDGALLLKEGGYKFSGHIQYIVAQS